MNNSHWKGKDSAKQICFDSSFTSLLKDNVPEAIRLNTIDSEIFIVTCYVCCECAVSLLCEIRKLFDASVANNEM